MADYVGGDMIRGHIDTIILNSLIDGDKDSNQIRAEIEARAGGQFQLKQGTFYSALQRIVKQGYVIEYRTTGPDGVRRKYFQLTEKGKDLIDKNQSSWTMSRQVINTLLDASQPEVVTQPVPVQVEENIPTFEHEKVSTFSSLETTDQPEEESVAVQVISSIDESVEEEIAQPTEEELADIALSEVPPTFIVEEDEDSVPQTFDDIMVILENIDRSVREEEEQKLLEEEARLERERIIAEEKAKAEEEERAIAAQVEQGRLERERTLTDVEIPDEFQLAEERSKNPVFIEEEPVQPVIPDYIQESLNDCEEEIDEPVFVDSNAQVEPEQVSIIEEPAPVQTEADDYLNPDNIPVQKEYKDVLSRIFASDTEQDTNVVEFPTKETQTVATAQNPTVSDTIPQSDNDYERIVEDLDFDEDVVDASKTKTYTDKNPKTRKSGSFDYSDIITMSEREGFKVSTSDKTNKSELGKILINRLNFHTSLIFFVLLAMETLLVAISMDSVLKYGIEPYIYFGMITLIFPVLCGMLYYMAPKRTIAEVATFKSSFETALIITLNLILMVLVYIVIVDLDFSSQQEVARNLFVPILMVINVPIYIIIRYSLLERQMYFS